jgi:cellobiose-specific phosphotransferase system component IIA
LKPTKKSSDTQNQTNIQQNVNISLNAHVFEALAMLDKTNPELAKKAFELIQTDIEEAHKEKQSIIELEKVAITSITIPIGVLALNFINSKKGQK